MNRRDAEQLLGGHATGNLTEAERQSLYAAALEHQAVFDALMDEEALRELLADPDAKARLLEALAPEAPKVRPLWRRTGVLGAAASLLVAGLAGIAYLRSPEKAPLPLQTVQEPAAKAKAPEAPAPAAPSPEAERKRAASPKPDAPAARPGPPPAPPPAPAMARAEQESGSMGRADTRDRLAKKAEAHRGAVEADAAPTPEAKALPSQPGGVMGGLVGGVVPGAAQGNQAQVREAATSAAPAKAARRVEPQATTPAWSLEPGPDGTTRVRVRARSGATVVLLRRGASGVEVLPLRPLAPAGGQAQWEASLRLAPGEALDLYLLNAPVAEPGKLPESGPVDGFRVRIHPTSKN